MLERWGGWRVSGCGNCTPNSGGGRRDGRGAGCNGLIIHSSASRKKKENSSGHTFEEDLQLERIAGRVKYLFYDRRNEGSYQRAFLCATLTKRQNASFLPAKASAHVKLAWNVEVGSRTEARIQPEIFMCCKKKKKKASEKNETVQKFWCR